MKRKQPKRLARGVLAKADGVRAGRKVGVRNHANAPAYAHRKQSGESARDLVHKGAGLGGEGIHSGECGIAAPKSQATGESTYATEPAYAGRKSKSRASMPLPPTVVMPGKSNRRSRSKALPSSSLDGEAGGVTGNETAIDVAPGKHNGHAKVTPDKAIPTVRGQATGEGSRDTEASHSGRQINAGAGDSMCAAEAQSAHPSTNKAAGGDEGGVVTASPHATTCGQIQSLQRRRVTRLKARIAIDNQLAAIVSQELGYHAGLEETDRKALRAKAEAMIKEIDEGGGEAGIGPVATSVAPLVLNTRACRNAIDAERAAIEKEMVKLAGTLPAWKWAKTIRGFGPTNFAIIVGECGDLSNYANPAKVWKRLGLAPIKGKMPSTWRMKGGLSAEDWTAAGYSPRRRSAMYVLSECLVKQNDGEYRKRYDETKAAKLALNDEAWPKIRAHKHGMLLAVKRLVRDLWRAWRDAEKAVTP